MKGVVAEDIINLLEMLKDSGIDEMRFQTNTLRFHVSRSVLKNGSDGLDSPCAISEHPELLMPFQAPLLGFFHSAQLPEEAPFITVNRHISAGDPLCVIRVLDQEHVLKADFDGYVRRIIPAEGELVEYLQTLFLIEPACNVSGGTL